MVASGLLIAATMGLLPGVQLVWVYNWAKVEGFAQCAADTTSLIVYQCDSLGGSAGSYLFEGAFPTTLAYWISGLFGPSYFHSFQIVGIAFVLASGASWLVLSRWALGALWPGFVGWLAFSLSPAVLASPGLPQLVYGWMLLPPAVLAIGWASSRRSYRVPIVIATAVGVAFLLLNTTGYALVVGLPLAVAAAVVAHGAPRLTAEKSPGVSGAIADTFMVGSSFAAAGLLQRLWIPGEALPQMSLDFFRASSVDVAGLVVPTDRHLLWNTLGERAGVDFPEFVDVSGRLNGGSPFIGILSATLLTILIVGVVRFRKDQIWRLGVLLGLVFAIGLVAIGPSFRFLDPWPPPDVVIRGLNGRLMPPGEADFSLPWSFVYTIPPLSYARVLYRWQVGLVLVIAAGASAGVFAISVYLRGRLRRPVAVFAVAGVVSMILIAEMAAAGISNRITAYAERNGMQDAFTVDIVDELDTFGSRQDVLHLPSGNDYLAPAVGPIAGHAVFNTIGDKNVLVSRSRQPDDVKELVREFDPTQQDTADRIAHVISSEQVSMVVLNYYSLRWDAYRWPPDEDDVASEQALMHSLSDLLPASCEVAQFDYFLVVQSCDVDG